MSLTVIASSPDAAIRGFQGEHRFLSNFWHSPITIDGWTFPTVEHAYQAAKSLDPQDWKDVQDCVSPGAAKRMGRNITLRADWDLIKMDVMTFLVTEKFAAHPALAAKLIATGNRPIIEENSWGDTYWGICRGKGENRLGEILMAIRQALVDR